MKKLIIISLATLLLISCGNYQQLLKSKDPEAKYNAAVEYFNHKEYNKAQTLFDDVTAYYRGTERSEEILHYLSRCYVGQKAYTMAQDYYETYMRSYPKGKYIVESRYMLGYCYYIDSPDARLDQTATKKAIKYLEEFLDAYPESDYAPDARKYLDEMYDKLAQKELLNAQLYYNLGTYLGNNYESARIVASNALKQFPYSKYREDFNFIILQSRYQEALLSVAERKAERVQETIDEYYNFITDFPDSKHRKAADKILTQMKKMQ